MKPNYKEFDDMFPDRQIIDADDLRKHIVTWWADYISVDEELGVCSSTVEKKLIINKETCKEEFLKMVSNEVEYKKLLGQNPYAITDIDFKVLMQRTLDNVEDASQKNNGKFKGKSQLKGKSQPREDRKTVVVLGTGWGSHAFVKLASTYDLRIVVVSPVNHFVSYWRFFWLPVL